MSGSGSKETPHLTVEEYETRLKELIQAADAADLDFEGEFVVGDPDSDAYWTVEVAKQSRPPDGDETDE